MSTVKANTYQDASGGNTAQINGTTPTIYNTMGKNRIINGDMAIDQRNAGASVSGVSGTYTLDRWLASGSGGSLTVQRVAGTGAYAYDFQLTGASGMTNSYVYQRIESVNCGGVANNNITIQAQLSSTTATSVEVKVYIPTSANSFPGTYLGGTTISINSTPTVYSWTVNAGANAGNGIQLQFDFGALTSGTARISGVQLEVGSVATEFERRQYGTELALCQRYYQLVEGGPFGSVTSTVYYGSTVGFSQMRVAPTPTWVQTISAYGFPTTASTAISATVRSFVIYKAANASLGGCYFQDQFSLSAEL